jgi:uncharacterized SAM-binding protein YcdF (DUF218 family)
LSIASIKALEIQIRKIIDFLREMLRPRTTNTYGKVAYWQYTVSSQLRGTVFNNGGVVMKIGTIHRTVGIGLIVLGVLSMINGLVCLAYTVSFGKFFLLAGGLLIILGTFKVFFIRPISSPFLKYIIRTVHIVLALGVISFVITEVLITSHGFKKDTGKPDYIVILGAGLRGETPSLTLYQRLNASLDLINMHKDVKVILSGGQGPGETISEAEAMHRYLISQGIPSDRLIKEDKSTNTLENLAFTKNIIRSIDDRNNITITIVTSNFHLFRSQFLAQRVGLKSQVYSADIIPYLIPTYFVREYLAVMKSAIFDVP